MTDTARLIRIATDERDHARALLDAHTATCGHPGCGTCRSLARHAVRTDDQLTDMLDDDPATEALF